MFSGLTQFVRRVATSLLLLRNAARQSSENVLPAAIPLNKLDFLNRFATTVIDEAVDAIITVVVTRDGRQITLWMGNGATCVMASEELVKRITAMQQRIGQAQDTTGMTPIDKMYIPQLNEGGFDPNNSM